MFSDKNIALIQLHTAVLLFGFTAILGRLIQIDEGPLVLYRMLITSISLLFIPRLWKTLKEIDRKLSIKIALTGGIVALHWVTFYGAIKYSNVSFAMCFMATASFFTAIIEPIVFRQKINMKQLGLGLLILPGIYMVFTFSSFYLTGMILGLIAAFLAALFGTLNKTYISKTRPIAITFIELSSGFLILWALMPLYFKIKPESSLQVTEPMDWVWLLILSLLCTTLAFILATSALKQVSAFTSALAINLEPIYAILLAIPIFQENEELGGNFYIGAGLIIIAIFMNGLIKPKVKKAKA